MIAIARHPARLGWLSDRLLAGATIALLAVLLAAILRGHAHWAALPPAIAIHLVTMVPAMALTPVMLLRRKADTPHRVLGYLWIALLAVTAIDSFFIRTNGGRFSAIHILSVFTLVTLVRIVAAARRHDMVAHRRSVRVLVIGALLLAGFFTLPFGRMLGGWLAGA